MKRHRPECEAYRQRHARRHAAFLRRYPRHCRHCQGHGFFRIAYDPSPTGVALGSGWLEDVEPCPQCEGRGRCALCNAPLGPAGRRLCGCPYTGAPEPPACVC